MAPSRDRNDDSERASKRKREKAETEEERRNRKKQKSKRKSLPGENRQKDDDSVPIPKPADTITPNGVSDPSNFQLVRQGDINARLEAVGSPSAWNVSRPIGGRMLDIDPVFSVDEV